MNLKLTAEEVDLLKEVLKKCSFRFMILTSEQIRLALGILDRLESTNVEKLENGDK